MKAAKWASINLPLAVPKTVPDKCAFRSLPCSKNLFHTGKTLVPTSPGDQNGAVRRQFLASHAPNRLPCALNSTLVSFQNT